MIRLNLSALDNPPVKAGGRGGIEDVINELIGSRTGE